MSRTSHNSTAIPQDGKCIRYDRETGDYACYLDGRLIGYAANYSAGETLCNDTYYAQLTHTSALAQDAAQEPAQPDATPITSDTWQNDDGTTYTDYTVGTGLTKVLVGTYAGEKDGVELTIGGCPINERLEQVLTLADVRQIRDNLSALLGDVRVQAHQARIAGLPPIPTVPTKTNRGLWDAPLGSIDGCAVTGTYEGRELMGVELTFEGVRVAVYDTYLGVQVGKGLSFHGDMYLHEWRIIQTMAAQGIVDRLLAHFAHYRTAQGGWACEGCGGQLAPDDEAQRCAACRERAQQARTERRAA
jgi:hypothetical protein